MDPHRRHSDCSVNSGVSVQSIDRPLSFNKMDLHRRHSESSVNSGVSVHSIDRPLSFNKMGSSQSVLQAKGYELVSEQKKMMLVKNKYGDQFIIKKLRAKQGDVSNFLKQLNHPHIVHHKKIIRDGDCLYLILEHCEGGDLSQKIKHKMEENVTFSEMMTKSQGEQTAGSKTENKDLTIQEMENKQILDWIVKICMALNHLHDQQVLHKNLQPESLFFTACGTIRLGEFGAIHEWSTDEETAETKSLSYVAPENLSGKPFDEKSEIWSLGCVIYEMCMLKCVFTGRSTLEIISNILNSSYEALPETFPEDLRQLVTDTLQTDPVNRPSVSEILMRPFIINHLYEKSTQITKELYERLKVLEELASGLERVHYNTTVGRLTGGVVGLAGGITSIVGLILAPFTLGASLIVAGVGISVAVAGGVTAGVSNITKMVNQHFKHQKIKMIITELKEKITSTSCCIQNIHIAVETQRVLLESNNSWSNTQSGADGRSSVGRIAAQTARDVRMVGLLLAGLFVALDIFFIALDAKEIHNLRKDYASMESQRELEKTETNTESKNNQTPESTECKPQYSDTKNHPSTDKKEQELRSEIMKFVKEIRETKEELKKFVDELKAELELKIQTDNYE